MFALGAAAIYFLVERDTILPAYRATMTTSAIICGVATIAYYFIAAQYSPDRGFPTVMRYFDWTITTPLLLLKYHEMLRVRGSAFAGEALPSRSIYDRHGFYRRAVRHDTPRPLVPKCAWSNWCALRLGRGFDAGISGHRLPCTDRRGTYGENAAGANPAGDQSNELVLAFLVGCLSYCLLV